MGDIKENVSIGGNEGKDFNADVKPPRLFLVDVSVSPETATAIADYIAVRGKMNVIRHVGVAAPVDSGEDHDPFERYLAAGIGKATCVLVLVSPALPHPWWLKRVAELGRSAGVALALLTLKGASDPPAGSEVFEKLRGIKSLNEYIFRLSPDANRIIFNNPEYGGLMAHTAPNHPLDAFLDWQH